MILLIKKLFKATWLVVKMGLLWIPIYPSMILPRKYFNMLNLYLLDQMESVINELQSLKV